MSNVNPARKWAEEAFSLSTLAKMMSSTEIAGLVKQLLIDRDAHLRYEHEEEKRPIAVFIARAIMAGADLETLAGYETTVLEDSKSFPHLLINGNRQYYWKGDKDCVLAALERLLGAVSPSGAKLFDPNHYDIDGVLPFHFAVRHSHTEDLHLLLHAGADPDLTTPNIGTTIFHGLALALKPDIAQIIDSWKAQRAILEVQNAVDGKAPFSQVNQYQAA